MIDLYDQHKAAFARVSAFVILLDGKRVATVALKFPARGEGRLYAYVHWIGDQMVRGFAAGYGYDKRTAAVAAAVRNMVAPNVTHSASDEAYAFRAAARLDDGHDWTRNLEKAGFTVLQAV